MNVGTIDGITLKRMFLAGASLLQKNKETVDSLNVFPVPDGDTGTNMSLTVMSAVNEINKLNEVTVEKVAEALANGSLMGARGNSGVILSQLFRGFHKSCIGLTELDGMALAKALQNGVSTAYKAVIKPVEGTILTVARESSEAALKAAKEKKSIEEILQITIEQGKKTLKKTPDLLPVLKQAGVVDAGGKGLIYIITGALQALSGEEVIDFIQEAEETGIQSIDFIEDIDLEFQYCTEYLINGKNMNIDSLRNKLYQLGDSLLVVGSESLIKVHIHSNFPGKVLDIGQQYGEITKIKIDNMKEQHTHTKEKEVKSPMKELGIIAVTSGDGLKNILISMGVDTIVTGGQTMNPSTEDFLKAIEETNAKNIIILPNNSNIQMAAEQTRTLSEKEIMVVPTKSFPQAIAALMVLDPSKDIDNNYQGMLKSINNVKTGQITYSVRDSQLGSMIINQGDILGLFNGKISTVGKEINETSLNLLKEIINEDDEILTVFWGSDVSNDQIEELQGVLEELYPDLELEIHEGGQPLYYYIFSVE